MQSIEATLLISAAFVGILTLFVLFFTGSIVAVLALWLVTALIVLVLWYYGFINMSVFKSSTTPDTKPKTPAPEPSTAPSAGGPKVGSEVFHIDDSQFTYADAPAVCAAYGAELATLEQIIDAYNHGAEWCSYGWSAGGFALYPTQRGTWQSLQAEPDTVKRTSCGRPGVNGGYFDPNTKFGVNCFGFKPTGKAELPMPPPGTDTISFRAAVAKFAAQLKTFTMTPYSRTAWSGYDSGYGTQFKQNGTTKENFIEGVVGTSGVDTSVSEAPISSGAYAAAPYGLKGAIGETGPAGPIGPQGTAGGTGPSGPAGAPGAQGAQGPQGIRGLQGANSTVPGPEGKSGVTDGKLQLGSWIIDGTRNGGKDVTFNKDGHDAFIIHDEGPGKSKLMVDNGGWKIFPSETGGARPNGVVSGVNTGLSTLKSSSTYEERITAFIRDHPGTEWTRRAQYGPECQQDSGCGPDLKCASNKRCEVPMNIFAKYGIFPN